MINANIRLIFDRKNDTNIDKNKEALLQIEVRLIGGTKRIFITTGKKVTKNQFTYKNGNFICRDRIDADKITVHVRSMLRQIAEYIQTDKCKKLSDVKKFNIPDLQDDLVIPFIESEMRSRGLRLSTIKQHNVIIHKLNEFGKILTFDDVTYLNISYFDKFMRDENMQDVSIHKKHSTLNSYLKEAVRKGLLKENPYNTFKVKRGKSKDPVYLTEEELKHIIKKKQSTERMIRIKDLFLFQCYTGLEDKKRRKENEGNRLIVKSKCPLVALSAG
ncbi:MAG: phage integrase SAM-like domain-containing protein [Dysgonomonas sp.]|nr:phage integrase SAM-like domain-containing protein [Dysgonomonas sp.]